MEIVILKNAAAVAATAADLVAGLLSHRPASVLGLATGSTQLALYRQLVEKHRHAGLSFKQTRSFNLDEYLGVAANSPQSYRSYMNREFFDHIDIDKQNTFLPFCSDDENPRLVAQRYEQQIREAGGIDLQLLGLGVNGHIGFNEPSSSLASRTRVKTLTQQTMEDNSRLFSSTEFQPKLALTMGIATIMDGKEVLLLATGKRKAAAVSQMVEGAVTAMCPASILQLHEHVTVLLDDAAASQLKNRDYYEWSYQQNESLKSRFGVFHG